MTKTNSLKNKVALITGAASGIGEATAKLFSRENMFVVVADINQTQGLRVVKEIEKEQGRAMFIQLDVSNELDWINAIEKIKTTCNQLNILVNNAGISFAKPITEISLQEWRQVMAVNLDGVFLGTKYAIELMKHTKNGSIINVASASGIVASPMSTAYCASKGGVRLFTKAAALECVKLDNPIRVNSICPAAVETPIWEHSDWWPEFEKKMGSKEAAWQALSQASPMGRIATADEIAKGIFYLASDNASYVTGTELVIDGGFTAQ